MIEKDEVRRVGDGYQVRRSHIPEADGEKANSTGCLTSLTFQEKPDFPGHTKYNEGKTWDDYLMEPLSDKLQEYKDLIDATQKAFRSRTRASLFGMEL